MVRDAEGMDHGWGSTTLGGGPPVIDGGTCGVVAAFFVAGSSAGSRRPPRNQVGTMLFDCTVDLPSVVVLLVVTLFGWCAASARIVVRE